MPAPSRPLSRLFTSGCFIALCAVALALETSLVTGVRHLGIAFYAFVFFATCSAYRVHGIVRLLKGDWREIECFVILIATVILTFALPLAMWPTVALSSLFALAYSIPALPGGKRLREFGVAKILSLTLTWTLVTAYLPAMGQVSGQTMAVLLLRRFLFMFALCMAFDLRDRAVDARAGIRTLPVRIGVRPSFGVMRLTMLAFAFMILIGPWLPGPHPANLVTAALLVSAVLTWSAIERSRRISSNLFYFGCIDGMMAAQGIMVAAATWIARR